MTIPTIEQPQTAIEAEYGGQPGIWSRNDARVMATLVHRVLQGLQEATPVPVRKHVWGHTLSSMIRTCAVCQRAVYTAGMGAMEFEATRNGECPGPNLVSASDPAAEREQERRASQPDISPSDMRALRERQLDAAGGNAVVAAERVAFALDGTMPGREQSAAIDLVTCEMRERGAKVISGGRCGMENYYDLAARAFRAMWEAMEK